MNITEANHVNTLLHWFLPDPEDPTRVVTEEDARNAAEYLADRAYKPLSAGLTAHKVAALWPRNLLYLVLEEAYEDWDWDGDTTLEQAQSYLDAMGVDNLNDRGAQALGGREEPS